MAQTACYNDVMSKKRRLIFNAITVSLVGIITGFFLGGHLLTSLPVGARIFIIGMAILATLCTFLEEGIMVMNERNRLVFSTVAVFLVGILTGLFMAGDLLPSRAEVQQGVGKNEIWGRFGAFVPSTLTVPAGTTVYWISRDIELHTVVSDNRLFEGSLPVGGSFNYTFTEPGTYGYFCEPHPEMAGVVIVE